MKYTYSILFYSILWFYIVIIWDYNLSCQENFWLVIVFFVEMIQFSNRYPTNRFLKLLLKWLEDVSLLKRSWTNCLVVYQLILFGRLIISFLRLTTNVIVLWCCFGNIHSFATAIFMATYLIKQFILAFCAFKVNLFFFFFFSLFLSFL